MGSNPCMQVTIVGNPLDLVGDATTERYRSALSICVKDRGVDALFVIVLYQTPLIGKDVADVIASFGKGKKPLVVVATGGEFTKSLTRNLEDKGIAVYNFPEDAIVAMDKLIWYNRKK